MAKVNWNSSRVKIAIKEPTRKLLLAHGFQVEAQTKVNITNNGQIDTGFMRNSTYVSGAGESTYGRTDPTGTYTSEKTGNAVKRAIAPERQGDADTVFVVVGADYAIHNEVRQSFLYIAVEQVVGSSPDAGIIRSEA